MIKTVLLKMEVPEQSKSKLSCGPDFIGVVSSSRPAIEESWPSSSSIPSPPILTLRKS